MIHNERIPLRDIPISTVVHGVEITGRIVAVWPNGMIVEIASHAAGWWTVLHVPHFAMCARNRLTRDEADRTTALTERGQRRADGLLKELYAHAQGHGSGWGVYPASRGCGS